MIEIKDKNTTRLMYNESLKFANEIRELQKSNHKFQKELVEARESDTDMKDYVMEQVLKATYDDGKKKYTNDTARKAAVRSLVKLEKGYHGLLKVIKEYESAIAINNIEIEHRIRVIKLNRAFLYSESRI